MPGTTPAASQLDWLISSTTTMVLFCSKAIRERLRSSTWVMGAPPSVFAQRQRCQTFAAVPIASGPTADTDRIASLGIQQLLEILAGDKHQHSRQTHDRCRNPAKDHDGSA